MIERHGELEGIEDWRSEASHTIVCLVSLDTCDLSSVPVADRLGVTSDSDRVKLLLGLNCQRTIINQSTHPLAILSGSSNDLLDGINKLWLVASSRCVAEH